MEMFVSTEVLGVVIQCLTVWKSLVITDVEQMKKNLI